MSRRPEQRPRLGRLGVGRAMDASFTMSADSVAGLLARPASGIPLGLGCEVQEAGGAPDEASWRPLRLELFGPRPREVAVLGYPELARLFALRAAACGAAVTVVTVEGAPWRRLVDAAGGEGDGFALVGPGEPVVPPTALDQPFLLVVEGMRPDTLALPQNRRSTLWVADPGTVEGMEPVLAQADALILGQGHADVVNRGLELAGVASRLATMMSGLEPEEVLVTVAQAVPHRVRIRQSAVEREVLGPVVTGGAAP